ncbi:MAG: patatin-like phospholipase family protein [Hyphomicrobiaceae bacterium]|nr:patatin-like phospholipase family protein [Hyphomicrobiaceae bacterium]
MTTPQTAPAVFANLPARQPRIGLALGGGGARGLAHILMLEAFDELGLRPHVVAGTSIGAIFGAAYASGYTAAQIRAHAEEVLKSRFDILRQFFSARQEPWGRMLNVLQLRSALMNPEALLDLVMPPRIAPDFAGLAIPLKVVAADFFTQGQVVIEHGPLMRAVAASMALPALFQAVEIDERALLDGGLVNPLPFDLIEGSADITVAINVSGAGRLPDDRSPPRALEAIVSSLHILQRSIVEEKLKTRRPDILIDIDVGRFHVMEFHRLDKVLEAAAPAKAELKARLTRILTAETIEALPVAVTPPGSAPPPQSPRRLPASPHQGRLADRLRR